jgi:hypothetical protein
MLSREWLGISEKLSFDGSVHQINKRNISIGW